MAGRVTKHVNSRLLHRARECSTGRISTSTFLIAPSGVVNIEDKYDYNSTANGPGRRNVAMLGHLLNYLATSLTQDLDQERVLGVCTQYFTRIDCPITGITSIYYLVMRPLAAGQHAGLSFGLNFSTE